MLDCCDLVGRLNPDCCCARSPLHLTPTLTPTPTPGQVRARSHNIASGSGSLPQPRLNEEEYEFIARDIMAKPPFAGYLKYHLPLKYASRCEEVRWEWIDSMGRVCRQDLIGGGKNSDLEYD